MPGLGKSPARFGGRLKGRGRLLVRYSGTEPLLRIMVEADTQERTNKIARLIEAAARKDLSPSPQPQPSSLKGEGDSQQNRKPL